MKSAEELYNDLVDTYAAYLVASQAEQEALERHKAVWQDYLNESQIAVEIPEVHIPDTVIVQDGERLYEINFDFEDYHAPRVQRIDQYATLHRKAAP